MSVSASTNLDFETLLSRDYRPARVAQLQVKPLPFAHHHHHHQPKQQGNRKHPSNQEEGGDEESEDGYQLEKELLRIPDAGLSMTAEQREFVYRLVTQTPAYLKHLTLEEGEKVIQRQHELLSSNPNSTQTLVPAAAGPLEKLPARFGPLELMDWESQIDWGEDPTTVEEDEAATKEKSRRYISSYRLAADAKMANPEMSIAQELMQKKRNPHLDTLHFDDCVFVGYGDSSVLARKAEEAPLILELGVAGQSVAHKVYQSTVVHAQHPTPAMLQMAYQARVYRGEGKGSGDCGGFDLSGFEGIGDVRKLSKQELNALIEAKSKKREQMAKDKTNRVTAALGTLALGGGKGRAITSSLMGPGGTERTGRPTRMNAAGMIDIEYIEQIDLVTSHTLGRDLSKVNLRQFHRPKLPAQIVRSDLSWQFQIRCSNKNRDLQSSAGGQRRQGSVASPFHHHHRSSNNLTIGPVIRSEADLSPSDGKLVIVEYFEERPPIQLSKGMCAKIINYYHGDKVHCPISAGGGDRPARRKRNDETEGAPTPSTNKKNNGKQQQQDALPRLANKAEGSDSILDWIGPLPKKTKDPSKSSASTAAAESIDVLPEGVTEVLHGNERGPFLGEVPENSTLTGLISNLFVAPMFRHEAESTDFLMILTPSGGASKSGLRDSMSVILRDFPKSIYVVGQTEPITRVHAPASPGEKQFTNHYISYQIARTISREQSTRGEGLRLDELQAKVLPNLEIPGTAFRQRLKQVAVYDKNTQIWASKPIGQDGYLGMEALGRSIPPEGVAAFETACAASRRLVDLGIHQLFSGNSAAVSVGVCMVYLTGQVNAFRELSRKTKRLLEISRSQKSLSSLQTLFYEKAAAEIESIYKVMRQKHEVAQFINEELLLAPWHVTGEFIEVHKKAEGTGMMKLTGLGDPSGTGEGFSFLREVDTKPSKSVGNMALNAQAKKITGTEDDLRKLTMDQMGALLRSYGMADKQIKTLKRWDRVHCIRDLSTKAASDGIGDGLERYARGEKLKLSEQKQQYTQRIQEIFRRQIAALSSDVGDKAGGETAENPPPPEAVAPQQPQTKKPEESEDDDDDDDDLADLLEQEMMDRSEANQLMAAHVHGGNDTEAGFGKLRAATQDSELSKDARDLYALRRERDEEKAAQVGLQAASAHTTELHIASMTNRKVIRKRITKTFPDGRQTTTFKFVLHPEEVGKIEARLGSKKEEERPRGLPEWNYQYGDDEKPPGHAMFEDDDNFEYSSSGRLHSGKRRGPRRRDERTTPRQRSGLQLGKLKTKISKEERQRKRKRDEEEMDLYSAQAKQKSTNNRKERGSIRDRRPHVQFAAKLEQIRAAVESRPNAGHFAKPVNRKVVPRYYEVISNPICLQTIRNKIAQYEYRKAESFLKDFELMKSNAVKFNGQTNHIAQEAMAIYEFVQDQIQANQLELTNLEEAVAAQMDPNKGAKKKRKGATPKKPTTNVAQGRGTPLVNLGDVEQYMDDSGSGEDDEILLGLQHSAPM